MRRFRQRAMNGNVRGFLPQHRAQVRRAITLIARGKIPGYTTSASSGQIKKRERLAKPITR